MAPDMSKDEVAAIQWPNMKTLKRLLATPPDQKTKTLHFTPQIAAR